MDSRIFCYIPVGTVLHLDLSAAPYTSSCRSRHAAAVDVYTLNWFSASPQMTRSFIGATSMM